MSKSSLLFPADRGTTAEPAQLADLAVQALCAEANLTPKPGLVDRRGGGVHSDMNLAMMCESAEALRPFFQAMGECARRRRPSPEVRAHIGRVGRAAESRMLKVTGGVNTHRGAIWSLGLLLAAAVMSPDCSRNLAESAGALARMPDPIRTATVTHGRQAAERFGAIGAKGEARSNFPHVFQRGLPALQEARRGGLGEAVAHLNALMAIMRSLEDTCLLHRGGMEALEFARRGADRVLRFGGAGTPEGWRALLRLDEKMRMLGCSPGGSADLLAASIFADAILRPQRTSLSWKF